MKTKELGRIADISFGLGGYQDVMLGVTVQLGTRSWGVADFNGTWSFPPSEGAKWTLEDQTKQWGEMCRWVASLLEDAKKQKLSELVNVPVEVTMEDGRLVSWRILKEVL